MTAVELMYMPIELPNSSKLQRIPVTSPLLPDGRAKVIERTRLDRLLMRLILTFEEGRVIVGIGVDLGELADADLLRECILDLRLGVEAVPVSAQSPWLELFITKGDTEGDREHLISALGKSKLFRGAADELSVVKNLSIDNSVVGFDAKAAASLLGVVFVEATA